MQPYACFAAEGDSCSSMLLLGIPSNTGCAEGLYCDDNSKCVKLPTINERELGKYKSRPR